MSREEGVKEILKRDHIKSNDLERWLDYVGWDEKKFDEVADKFRDPGVWWIRNNKWVKLDIDGQERSYNNVYLNSSDREKYFQE